MSSLPLSAPRPLIVPTRRTAAGLVLAAALVLLVTLRPWAVSGAGEPAGIGPADGWIGDRQVTAFDVDVPAVGRLRPGVLDALQAATRAADADGVTLRVNSGWRSRAYQRALLEAAIAKYGSLREARRWVNTPKASTHVRGAAVDVGPPTAARWLGEHGTAYGLCRVYANEPWHFERLTRPGGTCPALVGDAGPG